uniref:Glycine cleavage system H protein n=1 Tax=Pseudictyota dubia TaxID=2749911 RepID=A0A7R9VYV9_9STRA|mmetsp:Transcript_26948/g.49928  ORF Transcript_26948/g.49928 Transcript_26948/m.49928 type:complete len:160 (+) Transcript_26948:115-594(+)
MASAAIMMRTVARTSLGRALRSQVASTSVGSFRFASTHFTPAHEYVKVEDGVGTCGITDFAQAALGDIVFVDLPDVGDEFEKGDSFGSVESVKAASDVYAPVSGEIVEVNETLTDEPGLVNTAAEGDAWFIKIKVTDESELDDLMTSDMYKEHCEKESH